MSAQDGENASHSPALAPLRLRFRMRAGPPVSQNAARRVSRASAIRAIHIHAEVIR
jgi:hypothetical protein